MFALVFFALLVKIGVQNEVALKPYSFSVSLRGDMRPDVLTAGWTKFF